MTEAKWPTNDLPEIYAKLLWKSVSADPGVIEACNSVFEPIVSKPDDPVGTVPFPAAAEFGLVAEIRAGRFVSLAKPNPFEEPSLAEKLLLPVIYLVTDDERRGFSVDAVGGVCAALRFKEENGSDAPLPVVLFIENNQQLVRGCEVDDKLLEKLDYGIFARLGQERPEAFLRGCSFGRVHVHQGTPADFDAYDLPPEKWAEAVQRHCLEHFGPVPDDLVPAGPAGW
jgi:hypothetical protein